ncbi:nucleolar protein 13 [Penicillium hispanicum]|uniref:nucleolar protein 13 n=1 Tax=Penicillium hispanicum TaxID=1080232 RepID=UPI00254260E2|nr:nucleolar protein 13 [Penicillium hispanicum]KAJ5594509.1 nucleolar protein 13 [Penicillium hispanicum]
MSQLTDGAEKKRKLQDGPELEINLAAPEPPSKKALRKAKKKNTDNSAADSTRSESHKPGSNDDIESQTTPAKRSDYGIWIGNLGFSVTKDDLRRFFTGNCSFSDPTITRIHLPKGAEKFGKSQNKGFAYVDFSSEKALQEALGLSEQLLTGRRVLIKNAKSFEGRPEKPKDQNNSATAAKPGNPPSRRIFVGNLGFDVTKEAIEEHFGQCGTVTNVHLATFQDTGKCKGYGWVEFEEIAAAEAAVKGFLMIAEEDEEESDDSSDSDSEKSKKPKKTKQRRVWVNQLMGRRMRMEFAEDATTRYKKRFGKDGEGKKQDQTEISEVDGTGDQPQFRKPKREAIDESRYSKETVQRLSGAIVEAKGQKITFD